MSVEMLKTWLKIPQTAWPPDHYTLLGLTPGKGSTDEIEQRVLERMDLLRRYQLMHPDQVTEGMNRLAQAMICLTDGDARRKYDKDLGLQVEPPPKQVEAPVPIPILETPDEDDSGVPLIEIPLPTRSMVYQREDLDPKRRAQQPAQPQPRNQPRAKQPPQGQVPAKAPVEDDLDADDSEPIVLPREMYAEVEESRTFRLTEDADLPEAVLVQPELELETETQLLPPDEPATRVSADPARQARRQKYAELARIRRVLRTWEKVRAFLDNPEKSFNRRTDCVEFMACLAELRPLLDLIPDLIGEPEKPGYLIVSIARQKQSVDVYRSLLPSQHEAFIADSRVAHYKIMDRYRFIRKQLNEAIDKPFAATVIQPIMREIQIRPEWIMGLLGVMALILALIRRAAS